jgi:hypothetical protein
MKLKRLDRQVKVCFFAFELAVDEEGVNRGFRRVPLGWLRPLKALQNPGAIPGTKGAG